MCVYSESGEYEGGVYSSQEKTITSNENVRATRCACPSSALDCSEICVYKNDDDDDDLKKLTYRFLPQFLYSKNKNKNEIS